MSTMTMLMTHDWVVGADEGESDDNIDETMKQLIRMMMMVMMTGL